MKKVGETFFFSLLQVNSTIWIWRFFHLSSAWRWRIWKKWMDVCVASVFAFANIFSLLSFNSCSLVVLKKKVSITSAHMAIRSLVQVTLINIECFTHFRETNLKLHLFSIHFFYENHVLLFFLPFLCRASNIFHYIDHITLLSYIRVYLGRPEMVGQCQ